MFFRGFFVPLVCYLCSRIIYIQPVNLSFKLAEVNCFLSFRVKSWRSPLVYCIINRLSDAAVALMNGFLFILFDRLLIILQFL